MKKKKKTLRNFGQRSRKMLKTNPITPSWKNVQGKGEGVEAFKLVLTQARQPFTPQVALASRQRCQILQRTQTLERRMRRRRSLAQTTHKRLLVKTLMLMDTILLELLAFKPAAFFCVFCFYVYVIRPYYRPQVVHYFFFFFWLMYKRVDGL